MSWRLLSSYFAFRGTLSRCVIRMSSSERAEKPDNLTQQLTDKFFDSAATGNIEEVKSLLGAVPKDAKNERGWTALMFAARNGQLSVIQALVEKGCDVNIMNASGQTALDIASFWNHEDSAAVLRQHSTHSPFDQAVNYYSQNPLYRASDMRKNAEWLTDTMKKDSTKFVVFNADIRPFFTKGEGKRLKLAVMSYAQLSAVMAKSPVAIFLGLETWDPHSSAWFAVRLPSEADENACKELRADGYFAELFPRSRDVMMLEDTDAGLFAEAHSVMQWLDRYQFCSTCGSSTKIAEGGYKRVCDNKECRSHNGVHNTCYPRVDPSLIMLVVSPDNTRCLLGRQTRFPPKMYSCLAGFMEPGECIEDTCRREVEEESGVKVGRVDYHSSQPWPFPATLMLGCIAHARTEEIKIDPEELEDVRWFPRAEVAQLLAGKHPDGIFLPPPTAIARQLVMSWVKRNANL